MFAIFYGGRDAGERVLYERVIYTSRREAEARVEELYKELDPSVEGMDFFIIELRRA